MAAPIPSNDKERVKALKEYDILDSQEEESFDKLVRCVTELLDVPLAVVSLVDEDRQWFKANVGMSLTQTPREDAFCSHVVHQRKTMHIPDARVDDRFRDNPFVKEGLISYLGAPLISHEGHVLGSLCALDTRRPRDYSPKEIQVLEALADCVIAQMESRRARKLAQQQFLEAERARLSTSIFFASISHELRTPLNAIVGYSDLIAESLEEQKVDLAEVTQDVESIRSAGAHLVELIGDVLDLSKLEAKKMRLSLEPVNLSEVFEEVLDSIRPLIFSSRNVAHLKAPDLWVRADRMRLRQVIMNLMSNANKFTQDGTLTLGARGLEGGEVEFWVRDTGMGIGPQKLEKVFESFAQEDEHVASAFGGTGLGLAICKELCELMGGTIWAESALGKGATFLVRLPKAAPPGPQVQPKALAVRL